MKLKFISLFLFLSCFGTVAQAQVRLVQREPYISIVKRGITKKKLDKAITKLTLPAKEPGAFWSKIANDSSYPLFQRRSAAFQLLKRHAHVGMSLMELSKLLNHPTWLRYNDMTKVTVMGGWIPISNFSGSIFAVSILPIKERSFAAVYFRFPAEIFQTSFRRIMRGEADTQIPIIGKVKIAEIGLWEEGSEPQHYSKPPVPTR